MDTLDPAEAGRRFQEALEAPRPQRPIEEWVNDVGEGWRPLIRGLDANLRALDPDYIIGQIKEKFGGLRYYFDAFRGDIEECERLVRAAEELSFKICEACGAPGTTKAWNGFWVRTLCPLCVRSEEDARNEKKFRESSDGRGIVLVDD